MTFEEVKKILEKEGYFLTKVSSKFKFPELPVWEKQEVIEAKKIVNEHCFAIVMSGKEWFDRQERLKKEYEKNTKAPGPGEEQAKEGNPALRESASQFNDALLDEQGKKIKRLGKEISKLNSIIHDKNAVLSDVAEELRLSKIREKNLTEMCQKYMKENEKSKKDLADMVVDKIDAQALKSAESALAWKEKVIDKLTKENNDYKKCVEEFRNKIADMTIGKIDIQNIRLKEKNKEIKELNDKLKATKTELEEKTKLVETVRKGSKEYCEYGIAAEKMIQKMAKEIVNDSPVPSKDYKQYRLWANGYRFNPQLPDFSEEEEKKLEHAKKIRVSSDIAEEGADQSATIVECGKDIDDVFEEIKRLCQE